MFEDVQGSAYQTKRLQLEDSRTSQVSQITNRHSEIVKMDLRRHTTPKCIALRIISTPGQSNMALIGLGRLITDSQRYVTNRLSQERSLYVDTGCVSVLLVKVPLR